MYSLYLYFDINKNKKKTECTEIEPERRYK